MPVAVYVVGLVDARNMMNVLGVFAERADAERFVDNYKVEANALHTLLVIRETTLR